MKKLDALFIKLEQARAIEAIKRQEREEIERDIALEACPFSINQDIETVTGDRLYAIPRRIYFSEKEPYFWIYAQLSNGNVVIIDRDNIDTWKASKATMPPF